MNNIIYQPADAARLAINVLDELKQNKGKGVKSGISVLDNVMLPMRGAELITVLGYTSWYKTGLMNYLARSAVKQCEYNEIVIKVTWEDSVEEDTLKWIAADAGIGISVLVRGEVEDWDIVMKSYQHRITTPLWIVGHSNQESEVGHRARPRMTMTDVLRAIDYICHGATDNDYRIKLVVLDYLQRVRPDPEDGATKREQMMEGVNKAKDMSISFGCPVVLGVQASRGVLERDFKLPRLDDGLETSNIEQSSDKVLSLWYPIKTEPIGARIDSLNVVVNENLLILGLLKQKMGAAPVIMPLYVNPAQNIIYPMTNEEQENE